MQTHWQNIWNKLLGRKAPQTSSDNFEFFKSVEELDQYLIAFRE